MVIDFHTHAFPDKIAQKALSTLGGRISLTPLTDGTVDGLIENMEKEAVADISVICNIATNAKQNVNVNNFAIETKEKHGNKVIPLGSLHPDYPEAEDEIKKLAAAGIRGIKVHPDYMGIMLDDAKFDLIFELCAQYGLFVITHAGFDVYSPDKIWATPDAILNRIERSPKTKLVCAHYAGNKLYDEVEGKLMGKNIYFDTSLATLYDLSREQAARMILKHDPDKVLFGTDCPWCSVRETFNFVDSLALSDDLKEKIYSGNAKKLLQI